MHDVRGNGQQSLALGECLAHQPQFAVFQVAQAAVDQLGTGRGGVRGQVVAFDEAHAQVAARRVARDAGAVDAAADDQQVEVGRRISRRHEPGRAAACCGPARTLLVRRRSFDARVGLVARRSDGRAPRRGRSAPSSRASASRRLPSWVRWLRAMISISPASVRRRPASLRSRCLAGRIQRRASASRLKRNCAAVATLLTFCPPGPAERTKVIWTSSSIRDHGPPPRTYHADLALRDRNGDAVLAEVLARWRGSRPSARCSRLPADRRSRSAAPARCRSRRTASGATPAAVPAARGRLQLAAFSSTCSASSGSSR